MKFAVKQISKKVLSCVLALAVILCTISSVFTVFAATTAYSVTYGSPAIPMFVDKTVDLDYINVQFTNGGGYVSGSSIEWSIAEGTDASAITIADDHYLVANKKGIHKLTATADGYEPKNIYVVVNSEDDYNFYLANVDLTQNAELTGWSFYEGTTKLDITYSGNVGYISGTSASGTNRVYRTHDGYLEFMNNPAGTYRYMVYNSDIIKDFADYTVSSSMATTGHVDRTGFITRGDFTDNTALLLYYRRGAGVNVAQMNSICMLGDANRGFHTLGIGGYKDFANGTEAYTEIGKYYYADSQQYDLSATVSGSDILVKFEDQTVFDSKQAVIRLGSSESDRTTNYKNAFAESGKTDAGLVGFVQYNAYQERTHLYSFSVKLNVTSSADLPEFVEVPGDTPVAKMYSVNYASPAIPMFVDKAVDLGNIQVQFTADGGFVNGDSIAWDYADGTDTAAVSLMSGKIVAEKAGVHALTATYGGTTKNIYVVVNNVGNYDFYLVKENFAGGIDIS
ncbi:MAG: hypothetical protein IJA13_03785 [Clostridia bacterium]|nr:hypothetical protein [Clostridia bacterium]